MPMRILYDHQMFALQRYGGITRIFIELMKGLAGRPGLELNWHRGWHVDQYAVGAFAGALRHYTARAEPPAGKGENPNRVQINQELFAEFVATTGEFDIYHPTYYELATARIPRTRHLVLTVADLIAEKYFQDLPRFRPLLDDRRELILRADRIQVISESTRRDLLAAFPVDPAKVRLTYLASELDRVEEAPVPSEFLSVPYFLYVGTRSKYKNFDVLLRAFAGAPELPRNFAVVCFGGTNDYLEGEVKLMQAHGMRGRFHYIQGDDRLLKGLYRHALALVYTSRYEGFGLPPLESMECGCPVVCCPTSSLPEVVGDAALLFDPDDPAGLAATLLRLAGDKELRARLIAAGSERTRLFSWRSTVESTLGIYKELAS